MDIGAVIDTLTSGAVGGIIGGVSAIFLKKEERKEKEADNAHAFKMAELTLESQRLEQSHELAVADKELEKVEAEGEIAVESAEVGAFTASLQSQPTGGGLRWVRPMITAYLLILSTFLSVRLFLMTGGLGALDDAALLGLLINVVDSVFFLTTLSVSWWFGSRGSSKR